MRETAKKEGTCGMGGGVSCGGYEDTETASLSDREIGGKGKNIAAKFLCPGSPARSFHTGAYFSIYVIVIVATVRNSA